MRNQRGTISLWFLLLSCSAGTVNREATSPSESGAPVAHASDRDSASHPPQAAQVELTPQEPSFLSVEEPRGALTASQCAEAEQWQASETRCRLPPRECTQALVDTSAIGSLMSTGVAFPGEVSASLDPRAETLNPLPAAQLQQRILALRELLSKSAKCAEEQQPLRLALADAWSQLAKVSEADDADQVTRCLTEAVAMYRRSREPICSRARPLEPEELARALYSEALSLLSLEREPEAIPILEELVAKPYRSTWTFYGAAQLHQLRPDVSLVSFLTQEHRENRWLLHAHWIFSQVAREKGDTAELHRHLERVSYLISCRHDQVGAFALSHLLGTPLR